MIDNQFSEEGDPVEEPAPAPAPAPEPAPPPPPSAQVMLKVEEGVPPPARPQHPKIGHTSITYNRHSQYEGGPVPVMIFSLPALELSEGIPPHSSIPVGNTRTSWGEKEGNLDIFAGDWKNLFGPGDKVFIWGQGDADDWRSGSMDDMYHQRWTPNFEIVGGPFYDLIDGDKVLPEVSLVKYLLSEVDIRKAYTVENKMDQIGLKGDLYGNGIKDYLVKRHRNGAEYTVIRGPYFKVKNTRGNEFRVHPAFLSRQRYIGNVGDHVILSESVELSSEQALDLSVKPLKETPEGRKGVVKQWTITGLTPAAGTELPIYNVERGREKRAMFPAELIFLEKNYSTHGFSWELTDKGRPYGGTYFIPLSNNDASQPMGTYDYPRQWPPEL